MTDFIKRHQIVLLSMLICLFSLHMALTKKKTVGGAMIVEKTVSVLVTPLQSVMLSVKGSLGGVWSNYIYLVGLKETTEAQEKEIFTLQSENNRLRETLIENERLKKFLAFKKEASYSTVAARVLAFNLGGWTRTIKLNRGSKDGITEEMPIMSTNGVAGMIIEVNGSSSTALLITDPRSKIDVQIQRTRVRGVAEGNGASGLTLKYIRDLDDVKEGDKVITAGISGIFPKGLIIGEIEKVTKSGDNFFKHIEIKPTTELQRLEEVLIAIPARKKE
ncbi:MAG: rod shape-determining protein MreC [Thermodesulfobacteriota bacterium]